ncbi:hypothetical protein LO762_09390 [Actinocorallia sp. API 0066]|uniref:Cas10/Cmr2 second palm domain-containing protein n=1 Tax=Actinocorallia sp. API 0066 TaxID=2896846 RepID=UPI001E5EDCC7|nr:hypothetical protein [Actinocorallia sp. API 0066]MCD0449402.1 hypothetical protein [Actinocorallia sp. API 0066]
MARYPVVIGTSGTQGYIFASNKRRENVGASYLVARVEEAWLDGALAAVGGRRGERLGDGPVEIVTANAGGVSALVEDVAVGRELVAWITGRALLEAPGLDVCGAVGEPVDEERADGVAEALRLARSRLPAVRMARPGPQARFVGLPVAARCTSSGLPARLEMSLAKDGTKEPRSAASAAKLDAFEKALRRLINKMGLPPRVETRRGVEKDTRESLREVVDYLEDKAEWVAVVHADGNGLGAVFQSLGSLVARDGYRGPDYPDALRGLSAGVDKSAERAFQDTVWELGNAVDAGGGPRYRRVAGLLPILPLVLGGDDLTVVCDGPMALDFAERYLTLFARYAAENAGISRVLGETGHGLGACAGVAIVKPHFPFHSAVHLAESLTKEAKIAKEKLGPDRCALSFHVLYESAIADLARLRANTTLPDGTRLVAQPYVVGEVGDDPDGWARHRHWTDLRRRVAALERRDEDGRVLPASQTHDLRSGLFLGRKVADARFAALSTRLGGSAVGDIAGDDGSPFWSHDEVTSTGLLDAMDAVGFLHASPEART